MVFFFFMKWANVARGGGKNENLNAARKIEMDFCGIAMVQCGERCFFETEFGKSVYFTEEQAQNVLQILRKMWKN